MIVKGLYTVADHTGGLAQVVLVYIADGHYAGAGIGYMSATHSAHTNNAFGELIAGGEETTAEYMPGNNTETSHHGSCITQEITPGEGS